MDFFDILFDMKNGSKMPYSKNYFDTMFAAKLEELGVKTITGTLPLTFTTHTAGEAVDWKIYGNAQGVGERTENLFDKDNADILVNTSLKTPNEWTYSSGTVLRIPCEANQNYTLKQIDYPTTYLWRVNVTDSDSIPTSGTPVPTTEIEELSTGGGSTTFTTGANTKYILLQMPGGTFYVTKLMLVKGSTAPTTYIPYGYQIPIAVSQQGQTDKTVDIFIGDSPLTEGETVSKTSTGVDLELFEGENTVSTTLYNKPVMEIKYK